MSHSVSRHAENWRPVRVLAVAGLALLAYEAWTLIGWLAAGPFQITRYRNPGSTAWTGARILEVAIVAGTVAIAAYVIRDCRRRRALTFDAMLIVGLTTAAFWDPIYNWLTPAWLYSSDWLNVNDWLAHAPLAVNRDAGRMPWPIVPVLVGYSFWGLGFAALVNAAMVRARRRRPSISRGALVAIAFVASGAITSASFAVFDVLHLMSAPGYRLAVLHDSLIAFFFYSGGLVFGAIACLRFFTDRDGLRWSERGIDTVRPGPRRTATRLLATIAACQLFVIVGWGLLTVPASLLSSPYPRLPAHLINGLCNAPGVTGSTYGPCPGSSGFHL